MYSEKKGNKVFKQTTWVRGGCLKELIYMDTFRRSEKNQ